MGESEAGSIIDQYFGDIHLSDEQIKDLARKITTTDFSTSLREYSAASDDFDQCYEEFNLVRENLSDINLIIEVGNDVSLEEYIKVVTEYISAVEDVHEKHYVSLSMAITSLHYDSLELENLLDPLIDEANNYQKDLSGAASNIKEILSEALINDTDVKDAKVNISTQMDTIQEFIDRVDLHVGYVEDLSD